MSVRLKSRTQCPVGGFQFFQPETGFDLVKVCPLGQWNFTEAVKCIIAHRVANPRFNLPTDWDTVANTLDTTNALRMQSIPGAGIYIISDASPVYEPPKTFPPQTLSQLAAAGAGVVSKMAGGFGVIVDFIGEGGNPVSPELATQRAAVCATPRILPDGTKTERCPFNDQGDWTRYFTVPVSETIRKQLAKRIERGLSTRYDRELNVCEICSCPLKLKVHVPQDYIDQRMPAAVKKDLQESAPWCWIIASQKK